MDDLDWNRNRSNHGNIVSLFTCTGDAKSPLHYWREVFLQQCFFPLQLFGTPIFLQTVCIRMNLWSGFSSRDSLQKC